MRKSLFTLLCLCLVFAVALEAAQPLVPEKGSTTDGKKMSATPLTIIIDNLQSPTAPVVIGIYGPGNKFPDPNDQLKVYRIKPKKGRLVAKIVDQHYGEFALAVFQDMNSDGKIDKNVLGVPQEPYAFSNNYKPVITAPSFVDCKFNYNAQQNVVHISLIK